jgi:hypothetical protein
VVKYYKKKGDTQAKIHRPSHAPGSFAREFALFQSFFRMKSGVPWMQRLVKTGPTDKRVFQYQPPVSQLFKIVKPSKLTCIQTGGRPVGWVPASGIPKAVEVDEEANITALAGTSSAAANTKGNGSAMPLATPTIGISSNFPSPLGQSSSPITPAHSPRPDPAMTVDLLPQSKANEERGLTSSPGTAPTPGWATPIASPFAVFLGGVPLQ